MLERKKNKLTNDFLKISVKNNGVVSSIAWYMCEFLTLRNFAKISVATACLIQVIKIYRYSQIVKETNYYYMQIYNKTNYGYKLTYKRTN